MNLPRSIKNCLFSALILMVLAGVGDIHSHLCVDGQEPALSVHFENLNGHPQHEGDEVHTDVDNELIAEILLGKAIDQDSQLFLAPCLFVVFLQVSTSEHYVVHRDSEFHQAPAVFLPPLRGPPHYSS